MDPEFELGNLTPEPIHLLHSICSSYSIPKNEYAKIYLFIPLLMNVQVELNFSLYKKCFNKQLYAHVFCTYACISTD